MWDGLEFVFAGVVLFWVIVAFLAGVALSWCLWG